MNQEQKKLPVPPFTAQQTQALMNFVNEQIPMKWGKEILAFIEQVALDIESKQKEPQEVS